MKMEKSREAHILILGSPRSGTTLLAAMLSCHPKIGILNEDSNCSEFLLFSKPIRGNKLCIPNQIELKHDRYTRVSDAVVSLYQQLSNKIKRKFRMKTPVIWGHRATFSIRDYEKLAHNLYIIGIVRSPDGVIKSIEKRGRQSKKTAQYRWRRSVEILYELSQNRQPETGFIIIHYDRLVSSPEQIMKGCFEKLQFDYDESVLDGYLHTPQYKNMEIDRNKVSKGVVHDLNNPLLKDDKELSRKYSALAENSL